jgi:membrane protein
MGMAETGRVGKFISGARTLKSEVFSDHVLMVASGLAFHAMLAVLPTLAAIAAVWQLVGDQDTLGRALDAITGFLPPEAVGLAREFITSVPGGLGLGLGLALNLIFILWTGQRAASGIISALNIVFDEKEKRSRMRRALAAFGIALGGIVFILAAFGALALVPILNVLLPGTGLDQLGYLRWPLLGLAFLLGVGTLFSFGPSRDLAKWRPFTWGSLTATALWMLVSLGFSLYVGSAGSFGQLYGSISSVVVALLWFYLTALAVLTGAEIDAMLHTGCEHHERNSLKDELRSREAGRR